MPVQWLRMVAVRQVLAWLPLAAAVPAAALPLAAPLAGREAAGVRRSVVRTACALQRQAEERWLQSQAAPQLAAVRQGAALRLLQLSPGQQELGQLHLLCLVLPLPEFLLLPPLGWMAGAAGQGQRLTVQAAVLGPQGWRCPRCRCWVWVQS
jgi:hypothetical protein